MEYWCYDKPFLTSGATPRRAPIFWGNVVSNLVFFIILVVTPYPSVSRLRWLHSLEPWLTISTAITCVAVYGAAFWIPAAYRKRERASAVALDTSRDEVLCPPAAVAG